MAIALQASEAENEPNNGFFSSQHFAGGHMNKFLSSALAVILPALFLMLTADIASAQSAGNPVKSQVQQPAAPQMNTAKGGSWGSFDDDGDGILNCQDPDYVRPLDGSGKKLGKMNAGKGMGVRGGCLQTGAGSGNGTGVCDGTGPKGKGRGK
jgi:hypothetical protein